jgi:hypothetical protein
MADSLSQDEIDALLSTPMDDTDDTDLSAPERTIKRSFKGLVKSRIITVPYVAPVIKSDRVLFDPDINGDEEYTNVPVVRSLFNYKQYKKINCK